MYGPNTPTQDPDETLPEWHEPFPEPNTIPSGWSFTSAAPVLASAPGMDVDEPAED